MRQLPWILLAIAGCRGGDKGDSPAVDSEQETPWPDPPAPQLDTAVDAATWSLSEDLRKEATDLSPGPLAFQSDIDGYIYALQKDGASVWTMNNAYVHPGGTWCLDGTGEDCTGGDLWEAGRIYPGKPAAAMCADIAGGRLFLVQDGSPKIEIADLRPEGEDARTYLKIYSIIKLDDTLFEDWTWNGPCAYLPKDDALVLTSPSTGRFAVIGTASGLLKASGELDIAPSHLAALGDGGLMIFDDPAGNVVVATTADLAIRRSFAIGGTIHDLAVDDDHDRVWVASDAGAFCINLSEEDGPFSIPVEGTPVRVAPERRTGLAYVISQQDGVDRVSLVRGEAVMDSEVLPGSFLSLATPSILGDLPVFWTDDADTVQMSVYAANPEPLDQRPPLHTFLLTAIEKPFDDDLDMPCEDDSGGDSVDRMINIIEANAAVLDSLDIPIALAITANFAEVAERCGRTDVFDYLDGLGFELGVMVHNKPEYNCVRPGTPDVEADTCEANSPFACDPERTECLFPGDPGYCDYGDYDCYIAYMDARNVVIDRNLPGGGMFVLGADRHNMWGWDWLRGYSEMDRADGTEGFDVALFAHAWAYTGEVTYDDPRGKNPAPWHPSEATESWAPGDADHWEVGSAFSTVRYLPGMNTAVTKLSEVTSSGLFMLDFLATGTAYSNDASDYDVLTQLLRGAVRYRTGRAPNTWYFHIHELSEVNLADASGAELPAADWLRTWVATVPQTYVDRGELVWATPSEIRAAYPLDTVAE